MYNYDRDRSAPGYRRKWAWVAGLVVIIAVLGGMYALSDHRSASTASSAGATSQATSTTDAAPGAGATPTLRR